MPPLTQNPVSVPGSGGTDTLSSYQELTAGQELVSEIGQWYLTYQADGNLVGYPSGGGDAFWAAGAFASPSGKALMQTDGNLVLYDSNNAAYWSTGTNNQGRPPNYRLVRDARRSQHCYLTTASTSPFGVQVPTVPELQMATLMLS